MPRTTSKPKADEHAADAKEAAAAVDAKVAATKAVKEARAASTRTDEKTIARAIELYDSGVGLVKLTRQLTAEGHKSATGKEIRPQTVRQWIMRAKNVDRLGTRAAK